MASPGGAAGRAPARRPRRSRPPSPVPQLLDRRSLPRVTSPARISACRRERLKSGRRARGSGRGAAPASASPTVTSKRVPASRTHDPVPTCGPPSPLRGLGAKRQRPCSPSPFPGEGDRSSEPAPLAHYGGAAYTTGVKPAVDVDGRAGDIGAGVGGQEQRHVGELLRRADAAPWGCACPSRRKNPGSSGPSPSLACRTTH